MARTPTFDRDVLIERARDLFWLQGWAGTSMKDLEKALDIRPGSFYAAFGSKDALYTLALDRYAQAGAARLEALAKEFGPLEVLKQHLLGFVAEQPAGPVRACMLVKTLLEVQGRQGALSERAGDHLSAMEARFAALFREAQGKGEIAAHHDPNRLARRYQSDLIGLRATAERPGVDAAALAGEMVADLDALGCTGAR